MKTRAFFRIVLGTSAVTLLLSCGKTDIKGRWVQAVPGMDGMVQGIELRAGGEASSINMATLQYEKWQQQGDRLILRGKSVGNGQTIDFTDTLQIDRLAQDSLILRQDGFVWRFAKENAASRVRK